MFAEIAVRTGLAAVVAVLVGLVDGPLFGVELAWWVCALIGVVVVFGGFLIIGLGDD